MKTEIKQKWVNALRSGEYEQSKGYLYSEDGYCCLGVLCDIYCKETNQEWTTVNESGDEYIESEITDGLVTNGYFYLNGESEFLPQCVVEWSGMESRDPYVDVDDNEETGVVREQIVVLNDNGTPFAEIADLIEKQF
jgi:hypothetical protein